MASATVRERRRRWASSSHTTVSASAGIGEHQSRRCADDGQHDQWQHQPAVEQDLAGGLVRAPRDRHHRQAGAGIVVPVLHRQGPEVGWLPPEQQPEQQPRGRLAERCPDRRPSRQHGHAAGDPADHHGLRCPSLEPHGVDEHVEQQPERGEAGGQQVRGQCQHDEAGNAQHDPQAQRLSRRDGVAGRRPLRGTGHQPVDVVVVPVVDRVGPAGRQGAAHDGPHDQSQAGPPLGSDDHRRHRGDQQQLDDARLGDGDPCHEAGAPRRACRAAARRRPSDVVVGARVERTWSCVLGPGCRVLTGSAEEGDPGAPDVLTPALASANED